MLTGPTALTFVRGDTAQAAKAITTFNKQHEVLTFKGGFMAETVLDDEGFTAISRLPGREVLNGQLAGVVASPLTGLVRGLGSMIQGLALQLGQIAEKGLVTGEAPAAAQAPAEPAAEEAPEADETSPDETSTDDAPAAEAEEASEAEEQDNTSEQASNEEEG
jgi:large subunit ribosomal protein L10